MTNDILPIDATLLRQLKQQGKRSEAAALLRAYRANCERQKQIDKVETLQNQRQKLAMLGFCKVCYVRVAREGRHSCEHCADVISQSGKRRRTLKALKNQAAVC